MVRKHRHHKLPKHAGGKNDPENLVELSIEEHAEAHRLRWLETGDKYDFIAWRALSGRISTEEARLEAAAEGRKRFHEDPEKHASWAENIGRSNREFHADAERHAEWLTRAKYHERAKKISLAQKGRPKSAEFRAKMQEKGIPLWHQEKMSDSRRKSERWRKSVTSDAYRAKKSETDPRSIKVIVKGILYSSMRQAAKHSRMPKCRLERIRAGALIDEDVTFI